MSEDFIKSKKIFFTCAIFLLADPKSAITAVTVKAPR